MNAILLVLFVGAAVLVLAGNVKGRVSGWQSGFGYRRSMRLLRSNHELPRNVGRWILTPRKPWEVRGQRWHA